VIPKVEPVLERGFTHPTEGNALEEIADSEVRGISDDG
jgi:hypothetical protein